MKQISEKQLQKEFDREFDELEVKFYYWWLSSLSGIDPMDPKFDDWTYDHMPCLHKLDELYWTMFKIWLAGGTVTVQQLGEDK